MSLAPDSAVGLAALRRCRLFEGIDAVRLGAVAATLRTRRYRAGETIFHQDDPGDALHIVTAGAVRIVLPSAEDEEPAIMATLGPGDFFGALALFDDAPRSATAVAQGATETLVLRREGFLALIDEDRSLRHSLLSAMASEIRSITAHAQDLHFLDLPSRLSRRILRETEALAPGPDGSVRLAWPYTQAELAGMIGGSRQSVNRLLSDLVARGLIRLERDELVVPDRAALERSIPR